MIVCCPLSLSTEDEKDVNQTIENAFSDNKKPMLHGLKMGNQRQERMSSSCVCQQQSQAQDPTTHNTRAIPLNARKFLCLEQANLTLKKMSQVVPYNNSTTDLLLPPAANLLLQDHKVKQKSHGRTYPQFLQKPHCPTHPQTLQKTHRSTYPQIRITSNCFTSWAKRKTN